MKLILQEDRGGGGGDTKIILYEVDSLMEGGSDIEMSHALNPIFESIEDHI